MKSDASSCQRGCWLRDRAGLQHQLWPRARPPWWGCNREGFVEMVPWLIDRNQPPRLASFSRATGGDLHYYCQLGPLFNECITSMERHATPLLKYIDEIIMSDNTTTRRL
ncbi:uncharacterized protein AKAME5_002645100 [Lates japonicus]|uniref:Uncharacterized protein n=1 Tax=Lates japonicus TaxID=270547 RepID=A0AAD3NLB4_LATJO|nr:uncharacterized protein AKAME5_002645100 [Lates japonicus]